MKMPGFLRHPPQFLSCNRKTKIHNNNKPIAVRLITPGPFPVLIIFGFALLHVTSYYRAPSSLPRLPKIISCGFSPSLSAFVPPSLLRLFHARHHVVDAQDHAGGFDGGLEGLHFHAVRLPDPELLHVSQSARVAVDSPSGPW